jgi:hypothetical protein
MSLVWLLDDNQVPQQLHGHNPWLIYDNLCEYLIFQDIHALRELCEEVDVELWSKSLIKAPSKDRVKHTGRAITSSFRFGDCLSELYVKQGFSIRHCQARSLTKRSALILHLRSTILKLPSFLHEIKVIDPFPTILAI